MPLYSEGWEAVRVRVQQDMQAVQQFQIECPQIMTVVTSGPGPYEHRAKHGLARRPKGIAPIGGASINWTDEQFKRGWNDQEIIFTYTQGLAGVTITLLIW